MKYYSPLRPESQEPDEQCSYIEMLNQRHADNWRQLLAYLDDASMGKKTKFKLTIDGNTLLIEPKDVEGLGMEFEI